MLNLFLLPTPQIILSKNGKYLQKSLWQNLLLIFPSFFFFNAERKSKIKTIMARGINRDGNTGRWDGDKVNSSS